MDNAMRVLVLDDEPFMLQLLAHLLRQLGFDNVQTCESGEDALRIAAVPGAEPELILLDLNMPDMDGVEFVRELVAQGFAGSVVLVSGEDERLLQMAEKLILAHHVDLLGYLPKPFTQAGLARVIDRLAERRRTQAIERTPYTPAEVLDAICGGQLENHYQPKVELDSGAVVGVEALVRWRHPQHGLVFPDQFIGVAEGHGLIDDLTRVVVRNALRQTREWRDAGLSLRVAVNISMENLTSVDFASFMNHQAAASGISPQDVVLEVTESRLILDQRAPLEVLTRLRMNRYCLSIDDFGTGHSSLKLLRDIPFDELKIDRSFVRDARRDPTARAIYDASLTLGRQLGMKVVAEGVEDEEDWEMVRRTGCHLAQGYYIARPMPGPMVPAWVAQWQERIRGVANRA
jgi:EAL domain-containing protein (putative c-di-GMP-specific phosphodiesterase class I)/CheY-like chemotaxis protein